MNTNCMFTVLHVHVCISHQPTHVHSTLVPAQFSSQWQQKLYRHCLCCPSLWQACTNEQGNTAIMDHHRAQRDRYKRTTDMHQQRSPWKQTTDMESTWIIMEHLTTGMMDHHGNRHDGHHGNRHDGSPWKQTWWITMETDMMDHHGALNNRHDGSPWKQTWWITTRTTDIIME